MLIDLFIVVFIVFPICFTLVLMTNDCCLANKRNER